MDLLLKSHRGGIPIVGEIKALGDSTAFLALIQALTYLSELTTPSQRRRLARAKEFEGVFSSSWAEGGGPYASVYIFLEPGEQTLRGEAIALAQGILDALRRRPDLAGRQPIREIEFLEADLSGQGVVLRRLSA